MPRLAVSSLNASKRGEEKAEQRPPSEPIQFDPLLRSMFLGREIRLFGRSWERGIDFSVRDRFNSAYGSRGRGLLVGDDSEESGPVTDEWLADDGTGRSELEAAHTMPKFEFIPFLLLVPRDRLF